MHIWVMHTDGMAQSCEKTGTKEKKRGRGDNTDQELMKNLVDWMWKTRSYRSDEKKWAPVDEIPKQFRPKLGQILQFDWQEKIHTLDGYLWLCRGDLDGCAS